MLIDIDVFSNLSARNSYGLQKRLYKRFIKNSIGLPKLYKNLSYFNQFFNKRVRLIRAKRIWVVKRTFLYYYRTKRWLNMHFYYLNKIKKYYNTFYVVNKFIY